MKMDTGSTQTYKMIFNHAPVAIMVRDFSAIAKLKLELKKKKINKFRSHLRNHPRLLVDTLKSLRILQLNQAALDLFVAKNKKQLVDNLNKTLHKDASVTILELVAALLEGRLQLEGEFKSRTLEGKAFDVLMRISVPKAYEGNLKRAIITFEDMSTQKKYERHLKRLAQTDGLTRVLNHGAIRDRLEEEFLRAKRYNVELACLIIDMDKFKQINDEHGHQKGDYVLRQTASLIKENLREVDLIGRYGGDEFLVILPETSARNAKHAAERLRSIFEKLSSVKEMRGVYSTISIGICGWPSKKVNSVKDLIALADNAMYSAKKAGRNKIVTL